MTGSDPESPAVGAVSPAPTFVGPCEESHFGGDRGDRGDRAPSLRFADLKKACHQFFGKPRQDGASHAVFKTPWIGDPRINIQDDKGKAKAYQVRQVLLAIDKLERMKHGR